MLIVLDRAVAEALCRKHLIKGRRWWEKTENSGRRIKKRNKVTKNVEFGIDECKEGEWKVNEATQGLLE